MARGCPRRRNPCCKLPELTADNKPKVIFNQTIHDNCERRGHFENGEFVYAFGTEEEAKGYCLYPMGCRWSSDQGQLRCCPLEPSFVLGALLRAALASAAARLTPMILVRTGLKPTRPSAHRFRRSCASVAWLSSLRQLLGRSPAIVAAHSLSTALALKKMGRTDGGADFELSASGIRSIPASPLASTTKKF